jgi:hypothetical protein
LRTLGSLLPAAVAAVALLGLAGCTSNAPSAPEESSAPQSTPASPDATQHGGLAHCLSEHGVTETAVNPAGPPAGVDEKTWDEAVQACSTLAPGPGPTTP